MSTLHEIENIVAQFSPEELAELERVIRQLRLQKTRSGGQSALDLPPLDLGHVLQRWARVKNGMTRCWRDGCEARSGH